MPGENVELAKEALSALNRRDLEGYLALIDPEVEFVSLVAEAEGQTYRGHAGVRDWWNRVAGALGGIHFEADQIQDFGETMVVRLVATGRVSEVEVSQAMWGAYRLREGKVLWWTVFRTEDQALEALGLREQRASQENVEVCQRLVEALRGLLREGVATGSSTVWAVLTEFLDPGIELHDPDLPGGGKFYGHDGIVEYFSQFEEVFEEGRLEVEQLLDGGDRVVAFLHWTGRAKASRIETEIRDAHVWTLEDGKITHWRTYLDQDEALKDARLRQ